jgi:hypothetical protein
MIDVVTNPAERSITDVTHFKHHLVVVDVASRLFVPMGIRGRNQEQSRQFETGQHYLDRQNCITFLRWRKTTETLTQPSEALNSPN